MAVFVSVIRGPGPDDEVVYVQDAEERLRALGWIPRCEARTLAIHDMLRLQGFQTQKQPLEGEIGISSDASARTS